ncbi:MAG: MFS transporter [Planctomycetales bacterium]|nr:MFS transporter [Planctomycetales bacterium]
MNPSRRGPVPFLSGPSYRRHLLASALDGAFAGIISLAPFFASRELGAPRWGIVLFLQATSVAMLTSTFWAGLLASADRLRVFVVAGLAGRLTLCAVAATSAPAPFLVVAALHAFAHPAVLPALNVLWQANYPAAVRGRILGRISVVGSLATGLSSLAGAQLFAHEPGLFRVVFPVAGFLGFGAYALYGLIRIRRRPRDPGRAEAPVALPDPSFPARRSWSVPHPIRDAVRLLRGHPAFAVYEVGFMVYGFGFFFAHPLLADYCARDLELGHEVYGRALFILEGTKLVFSPIFGRLLDRLQAPRASALSFLCLAPFAVTIALAEGEAAVYAAFAIFGVGMAGVNVCWTLGTIEFAGREDAGPFMGVHAACVGIRTLAAPQLAYALQASRGHDARVAFLAAAGFFLAAVAVMGRLARRRPAPVLVPAAPHPVPAGILGAPKPSP